VLIVLGVLAWGGQAISWIAPAPAVRWGLSEAEVEVEPTFWADIRGEAPWDALTLWTLPVAGLLLVIGSNAWPHFGLAGGSVYAYFAGRGLFTRTVMLRRGLRIGAPASVRTGLIALVVWLAAGIVTVWAAVVALA
jgi:hypothetical protein